MPTIYPGNPDALQPNTSVKRSRGEDPVPAPGHRRDSVPTDFRSINGWGADLDPKNRPSYPKELPSNVTTVRGDVGTRQVPHDKVHVSNEHPDLTPVFGVASPPHGLSGALRDYAFEYGEATNRHWMTLMLADRIDVFESLVRDAFRGRPDNYIKEKGWAANLKYSDERPLRHRYTGFVLAAVGAVAVGLLVSRALGSDDD